MSACIKPLGIRLASNLPFSNPFFILDRYRIFQVISSLVCCSCLRRACVFWLVSSPADHGPPKSDGGHIDYCCDSRHDRISNDVASRSVAELQAETAVDDSDNHQCPSIPAVKVAKDAATLNFEVVDVVDDSEDGLQTDETDENNSQASVGLLEELIDRIYSQYVKEET